MKLEATLPKRPPSESVLFLKEEHILCEGGVS